MITDVPAVSVIVCTYNDRAHIGECVNSILRQTYPGLELIIIDDGSTDDTPAIIQSYEDPRIQYIRPSENTGMMGKLRNLGVSRARGDFVFFTDADCTARPDWVETGLRAFADHGALAVEGRIVYYRDGYSATLSDIKKSNEFGGLWMTGNMAYRKAVLENNNFDQSYSALEDRELGMRISRLGPIPFIQEMVVYHAREKRGIKQLFKEVEKLYFKEKIRLNRQYGDRNDLFQNRLHLIAPGMLLLMLFPPLIFIELFSGRIKSLSDLKLLPFLWPKAVYLRFAVWSTAIREKVFIL